MSLLIEQPQSIVKVWRNTFQLYKRAFLKVLPLSFLMAIIYLLPNLILFVEKHGAQLAPDHTAFSLKVLVATLIMMVIVLWFAAIMFLRLNSILEQQRGGCLRVLWIATYKYLICFAAMFLLMLLLFMGTLAFILPGIFLLILFKFILLDILVDDGTVFSSFKNSAHLVWGNWWRTFAVLIVPNVIIAAVHILLMFILTVLWIFVADKQLLVIAQSVLTIIYLTILLPFMFSLDLSQYRDLKLRAKNK